MTRQALVYIMANANRTLYIGVTSDLDRRVREHKHHVRQGCTRKYDLTMLVYVAEFGRMDDAIASEKALKGKTRAKKLTVIAELNPRWNDLAWDWYEEECGPSHGNSQTAIRYRSVSCRPQNAAPSSGQHDGVPVS